MPCDVPGCSGQTFMGWRPLSEPLSSGRKICEQHWRRHRDEQDIFDLFEEFGFKRPPGLAKPVPKKDIDRCACGKERDPSRRFCAECAAERERQRKRQAYHNKKNRTVEPIDENTLRCRQCDGARLPGHTYCEKCARRRKIATRRQAQSRYWKKQHIH